MVLNSHPKTEASAWLQVMEFPRIKDKEKLLHAWTDCPKLCLGECYKERTSLSTTICNSAVTAYGKKEGKSGVRLTSLKRIAFICRKGLGAPDAFIAEAQQTAWRHTNEHWPQLCSTIQQASDAGNERGVYGEHQTHHRPGHGEVRTTQDQR